MVPYLLQLHLKSITVPLLATLGSFLYQSFKISFLTKTSIRCNVIKGYYEDFCPSLAKNMKECIRCPPLPCLGPSMAEVELPLLQNAISSFSPQSSYTLVDVSGSKEVDLKEWLQVEPQLPLLIGVSVKEGEYYIDANMYFWQI